MSDPQTEQIILGELRAIRRAQEDLAFQVRIDRPFIVLKDQLAHLLTVVSQIPMGTRVCIVAGILLLGLGAVYRSAKAAALGLDFLFASLLFVGVSE